MPPILWLYLPVLISPAVVIVLSLVRGGRWYFLHQVQLAAIVAVAATGLVRGSNVLLAVSWAMIALFGILPGWMVGRGNRCLALGRMAEAERAYKLVRWFAWGNRGRLAVLWGTYQRLCSEGDVERADRALAAFVERNPPRAVQRELRLLQMQGRVQARQWQAVLDLFEANPASGTPRERACARLTAARAYVELGRIEHALLCLELVVESAFAAESSRSIAAAKVFVFAVAGDLLRLQAVFRSAGKQLRRPRHFEPYWFGRCHLARGELDAARQRFRQALELAPDRPLERQAMETCLTQIDSGTVPVPIRPSSYEAKLAAIQARERATADFRQLVSRDWPGPATWTLLATLVLCFVGSLLVVDTRYARVPAWLANDVGAVARGEWWRLATCMFMHDDWLHLGLNALTLFFVARPAERYFGTRPFLFLFFGSGVLASLASNVLWPDRAVAVGASGAICGLIGALLVAMAGVRALPVRHVRNKLCIILLGLIILQTVIDFHDPRIDKVAHLAGVVSGALLGAALKPWRNRV